MKFWEANPQNTKRVTSYVRQLAWYIPATTT